MSAHTKPPAEEVDCSHAIIGAAVEVQRVLGVGLLAGAYASALAVELAERELQFERDVPVTGKYKGVDLGVVHKADLVVERSVVVAVTAVEGSAESQRAQLLSCLRLSGHKIGLLINFHAFPVVKGIHRVGSKA